MLAISTAMPFVKPMTTGRGMNRTAVPVPVSPSMSAAGANSSNRFFGKMEGAPGAGQTDHRDFMSPSELRLLSEWLDIGAQYYNDPFVAPEN